jgi:ABC-type phosphate/phosphonate transport system substrate-binding protein
MKIVTQRLSFSPESGGRAKPNNAKEDIKILGTTKLIPELLIAYSSSVSNKVYHNTKSFDELKS